MAIDFMRKRRRCGPTLLRIACIALTLGCVFQGTCRAAENKGAVEVTVNSSSGMPIAGAQVVLRTQQNALLETRVTDGSGQVLMAGLDEGNYSVAISSSGFSVAKQDVAISAGETAHVTVELRILPVEQMIVVSSTQTPEQLADVPIPVTILNSAALENSPSITLDDFLRQVPSFSLFRRTSSLVAQPTTEGVSLRGIGASGVSRTLVFLDGVPMNDPVGSWIYWAAIPKIQIKDIEVAPGGVSSLYGSSAMAGVIDVTSKQPRTPTVELEGLAGSGSTADLDYLAGSSHGRWSYSSGGSFFRTGGYTLVPEPFRGSVDVPANSQHETANARVGFQATQNTELFLDGRFFNEDRGNGTRLQNNSTREGALNAGLHSRGSSGNEWRVNIFSFDQIFHSSFSAVAPDRQSETLSLLQREPAYGYGGNVLWSRPILHRNLVSAGGDARWTFARDQENAFSLVGANTTNRRIPGEQALAGAFLQDFLNASSRLNVIFGVRADVWKNYGASLTQTSPSTGTTTITQFPGVSKSTITPHAGLVLHLVHGLRARAGFYQGFRAPTLDELYRGFRVGSVVTLANANLGPERVTGYEFGLNQQAGANFFWRVTAFADRLKDPVSNVTISATPTLITNQRENLGFVNVKGIEASADYRAVRGVDLTASYVFEQPVVGSFPQNMALAGNLLPQVPKHRATLIASYRGWQRIVASVSGLYESHRFDDVSNNFKLGSFLVVGARVSRQFGERWMPFVEVENLLDRQYPVAATPVPQIGTPFMVLGGVRFQWSGT